jgi:hypothetical protein
MRSSSGFLSLPLPLRPVRAANAFFAALLEPPPAPPPPPPPPPLLLVLAALRLYVDEDEVVDEVGADCAVVVSKDAFNAKRRLTWGGENRSARAHIVKRENALKVEERSAVFNRHCHCHCAIAPLPNDNDNANANSIPYPYSVQLSLSFLSHPHSLLNNVSFCARR